MAFDAFLFQEVGNRLSIVDPCPLEVLFSSTKVKLRPPLPV